MASMWNEKTFKKKFKYQNKRMKKVEIPTFIIIILIFYFLFEKVEFFDLLLLSGVFTLWVFSTIDMFIRPPHIRVPDHYTEGGKILMFVSMWIIGSIVLIFIGNMISNKYYS